ncbi:unnamed protein product [Rotaria magnacalcarata]|uniref:Glycosyltransferase 61 catalytic domain-containing protein n=1 Tax=Rotaria magnacalcarata TaxID=392030 RepID=A0A816WU48_9BILA|nr:unnamed protein product [Rotaria magnacalcarata]CAF3827264.1 unnamed protein product [Rotaria magnacalcarata]
MKIIRLNVKRRCLCTTIAIALALLFGQWMIERLQTKLFSGRQCSNSQISEMTEVVHCASAFAFANSTWICSMNLSHYFDWTWYRNGDYNRYLKIKASNYAIPQPITLNAYQKPLVVNDVKLYLSTHPQEGFIVDDFRQLPNTVPHSLPIAKNLSQTCHELNLTSFNAWLSCVLDPVLLARRIPATTHSVTIGIFNAFVDRSSSCGPEGTVYTSYATFRFQKWSTSPCHNSPISANHTGKTVESYDELLDSVGVGLSDHGHFAPQQLPRILRLLAVTPSSSKLLVASGGKADQFMDILVERSIVTRDRIVPYDKNKIYQAKIVYRSETWPYLPGDLYGKYLHDRTDMEIVYRSLIMNELLDEERDLVLIVMRKPENSRSLINHDAMVNMIEQTLRNFSKTLLKIELFTGENHIKDQIKIWQKSKIVIAPHGAGLVNIMWMKPGSFVIEIGYESGWTLPEMYFEMATHCQHKYWLVKARGAYDTRLSVDLADLHWAFVSALLQIPNK